MVDAHAGDGGGAPAVTMVFDHLCENYEIVLHHLDSLSSPLFFGAERSSLALGCCVVVSCN